MERYEVFNQTSRVLIDEHQGTVKKVINSDRESTAHSTVASMSQINNPKLSKNMHGSQDSFRTKKMAVGKSVNQSEKKNLRTNMQYPVT